MDARAKLVRDILRAGDQFVVPFFQRHYSWKKEHWARLWNDIVNLLDEPESSRHFLGPLVCTPLNPMPGEITAYQLIDGQQRLMTIIRVRNCIAHAEGSLKNRDDAATIKAFAKDIPTLTVDERDHLAISKGFVENSTHEMRTFLDRLHDAVGKRLNVQQSASPLPRARGGHPEGER